jgi:hypothetical protein
MESFVRSIGAAFGVAVFGAILTNRLLHNLTALLPQGTKVDAGALTAGPEAIRRLPPRPTTP